MSISSRRRVIIDTDAKNEADDQFAIVHALLSPSLEVRGLIASPLRHLAQRSEHGGISRRDRPAAPAHGP
jgi:purine nucleosidase